MTELQTLKVEKNDFLSLSLRLITTKQSSTYKNRKVKMLRIFTFLFLLLDCLAWELVRLSDDMYIVQ